MNASPSLELRRDARDRPGRRPVHAARLLLQDLHPPAAPVAAVREGAAPRRRARQAAQEPARARVAHRVPPPPRRRARGGRRRRRPERRDRRRRAGRRRGARATRARSRAGACWPRAATSARASWPSARATAGVELLANAPALGAFDGLVPVWQGDTLHQVRAQRIVYATGAIEQPLLFPGNDLPGVMLSGGARAAGRPLRAAAGHRAPWSPRSATAASRPRSRCWTPAWRSPPWPTCAPNGASRSRRSRSSAERASDARRDRARGAAAAASSSASCSGRPARRGRRGERALGCDLLVVSGGSAPATSLLSQVGRAHRLRRASAATSRSPSVPDGVLAAGEVAGAGDARRRPSCRARWRAPRRRTRSASATTASRARADEGRRSARAAAPAPAEVAVPPPVTSERQRQVLRLPVRGRDGEGHPPERGGGLRLDRALQALHDDDDGPVPGPHVPAARRCG